MSPAAQGNNPQFKFDAFRLASGGEVQQGTLDARSLTRLADRFVPGDAAVPLDWRLQGGYDQQNRPTLTIEIEGTLPLICQRCLQTFEWPVSQSTVVLLARNEPQLAILDEDVLEVVLASEPPAAGDLIEDELLLSMPFSPVHPEGQCPAVSGNEEQVVRKSPFADLAALKRNERGAR